MGKLKSERERKLQKKLIPVNIIVCIIALVAALTLFLTPILKVDVGGILHDDGMTEFIEEKIDEAIDKSLEDSNEDDINYKPVVTMIVKNVLSKAEGDISVSALSAFRVVTGSGDKTQIVMDDLLFGKNALATKLIDSVVDAVANMFETKEGKDLLEETVISTMSKAILKDIDDEAVAEAFSTKNVKELVDILRDLGDEEKVPDGKVDGVADRFIEKIDSMLGSEITINDEIKENLTAEVQKMYDNTKEHLKEDETLTMESIICVTVSENLDLSQINIEDMITKLVGGSNSEGSLHLNTVEEELGGKDSDTEGEGSETGGSEIEGGNTEDGNTEGGNTEGEGGNAEGTHNVVTTYDGLLLEIGYDKEKKEEIKETLHKTLNEQLDKLVKDKGVDDYMGYYQYIFYGMLAFIVPWVILFLFSFFHLFAKNKRFTMWYVKLICWIPPVIWLALKLFPLLASKISFLNEFWSGEYGAVIKAALSSVGTYTWISGLCYVLLWLVSIFWAFPIKHKIRKERKNPEVEDAPDDEFGSY